MINLLNSRSSRYKAVRVGCFSFFFFEVRKIEELISVNGCYDEHRKKKSNKNHTLLYCVDSNKPEFN